MALALLALLTLGFGGAFLTARRWMRTGSSLAAFPWAASLVVLWPVLLYEAGGESARLVEAGWELRRVRWFVAAMVALLVLGCGWIWAERPPLEDPPRQGSRLGKGTFQSAMCMLLVCMLAVGLPGQFGVADLGTMAELGVTSPLLIAAGALNLTCFFAAMLDRATGRRKPPWFLGSLLGFVAVMVYAQQAVFEIVRAGIAFF